MTLFVSEKFKLEDFFASLMTPYTGYTYFISMMMLILSFFMTAVSYS